jgi:hypothetical protein
MLTFVSVGTDGDVAWWVVRVHEVRMNVSAGSFARRSFDAHAVGVRCHWEVFVQCC